MVSEKDRETTCGLGPWRPQFLQPLASKKVYMFFYGALGIIQGMFYTYMSATLSTLERQFGIKSKEAAYMMSGNEISQILFVFAMPVMIKLKKRPLWTTIGLFCSAFGCFLMAVPHLMAGDYEETANYMMTKSAEAGNGSRLVTAGLCGSDYHPASLEHGCDAEGNRQVDVGGLTLIFIGIVLTGVGNCAFYTFGLAYLDDNTSHENSPIMLGITYTFRLLGPTLGFLLGSFCLKTYVYPSEDPGFAEGDPRWIGAWWLGYPIIGSLIVLFAGPLACFPQRLPKAGTDAHLRKSEQQREQQERINPIDENNVHELDAEKEGDKEEKQSFVKAFLRLLRNKLFMYNFFSGLFYVFAFMGFGTFMPKYIEYQFRKTGSRSSTLAGTVGTVSKALGLLVSGFVISKFKPSARFISGYNVLLGGFYFTFLIVFSFMGCPTSDVYGTTTADGDIDISGGCNLDCACPQARLQPICAKDGVTNFYSPCQAGCLSKTLMPPSEEGGKFGRKSRPRHMYDDCSCVLEAWREFNHSISREWVIKDHLSEWDHPTEEAISRTHAGVMREPVKGAADGWCKVDCEDVFRTFMICMFILMVLGSTGRIGNVLVALRSIEVRDKSLSMAFNVVFLSLFAMLPAPMVYGAIIDSTCILWQQECGEKTNCLLYDTVKLRRTLMLSTAFIMVVGVIFDIGVWYHSKDLIIFNPEQVKHKEEAKRLKQGDQQQGNIDREGPEGAEDGELLKVGEKFASNVSLARDNMYKNGIALGST